MFQTIHTILVCVDGSPEAERALLKVLENIDPGKTKVSALYVISPSKYATIEGAPGYEGAQTLHEIRERIIEEEKDQILSRMKSLGKDHNVAIEMMVRLGDPRSEILKTADEVGADLIAVGSTGKGLGERLLLGSVSTYIVTHSKKSTLVLR
jgi:nucleotide-binding universal stress UspA family protein